MSNVLENGQPEAVQQSGGPVKISRGKSISAERQAHFQLRAASNFVKRMADLSVDCLSRQGTRVEMGRCVDLLEQFTSETVRKLGYDPQARSFDASWAMISEACAAHMHAFCMSRPPREGMDKVLDRLQKHGNSLVDNICYLMEDDRASSLLQMCWPQDTSDAATATSLLVADMTPVVNAIQVWDYGLEHRQALGVASAYIRDLALAMMAHIVPEQAAPDARMFHYQTLLKATGRIYAAAWERSAAPLVQRAQSLQEPERSDYLASRDTATALQYLARIEANTMAACQRVFEAAVIVANGYLVSRDVATRRFDQMQQVMAGGGDVQVQFGSLLPAHARQTASERVLLHASIEAPAPSAGTEVPELEAGVLRIRGRKPR